ncbi:spore cortex-lytic enzyme precursor [Clostridium tepidiprofundi DSM 19306]|uniref:Spore cortex-lytic enzyme n=1 Tax=Clostridium tepidiprofundi DSM 19306 TaxID=1121338 RepID=A0A151AQY0_9CLOT|nr:peptidoglycan-binding protein [Clostridium tepidiprofundi]KYH30051.1 spore cortex-lytic enzyme precursor [Clostridium tepidiprofundi DSM 19306]
MLFKRNLYYTSPMMNGTDVIEVQTKLNQLGYNCGTVDGWFGSLTDVAVRNFQRAKELVVDGIVGINTWNALFNENPSGSTELNKFVSIASGEVGYTEGAGNITKYGKWYGLDGNPWCAMFVSWCANQAGILNSIVPKYSLCSAGANWYKNLGKYKTRESGYTPKSGDVIFFNVNGGINHTGIVKSYSSSTVYTIEGNKSNTVRNASYNLSNTILMDTALIKQIVH